MRGRNLGGQEGVVQKPFLVRSPRLRPTVRLPRPMASLQNLTRKLSQRRRRRNRLASLGGPFLRVMRQARPLLTLKSPLPLTASQLPRKPAPGSQELLASPAPLARPLLASPLKPCFSLLIWVSMLTMMLFVTSSPRLVSMLSLRVLFAGAGDTPGRARVMALLMSALKRNKRRVLPPFMTRKSIIAPLSSKLLSMHPRRTKRIRLAMGLPPPNLSDYRDPVSYESFLLTTTPIFTLPFYVRAFFRSVICAFAAHRTCPLYGLVPLYCSSCTAILLVNGMIALLCVKELLIIVYMPMSTNDDDYLSDKFLVDPNACSSAPRTYSQRRKETQKRSQLKDERNRTKSRRQLELESRESGLSKSLFERAKEEEASGVGFGNKALSIMMKMGFKPGQSLGRMEEDTQSLPSPDDTGIVEKEKARPPAVEETLTHRDDSPHTIHKTEPLPLQEWTGKKGIGLGKRPGSPSSAERLAKMAKMAEEVKHHDFRERARDEYNNRRAEGRLGPAQLTCRTLDERMGKSFNVLWLNPGNNITFPPGLIEAMTLHNNGAIPFGEDATETVQIRMRKQMQADALQPLKSEVEEEESSEVTATTPAKRDSSVPLELFPHDLLEEITQFLRLQAQDRLQLVLAYLRDNHAYCFWCGVEYGSIDDMLSQCPGPEEDEHD